MRFQYLNNPTTHTLQHPRKISDTFGARMGFRGRMFGTIKRSDLIWGSHGVITGVPIFGKATIVFADYMPESHVKEMSYAQEWESKDSSSDYIPLDDCSCEE